MPANVSPRPPATICTSCNSRRRRIRKGCHGGGGGGGGGCLHQPGKAGAAHGMWEGRSPPPSCRNNFFTSLRRPLPLAAASCANAGRWPCPHLQHLLDHKLAQDDCLQQPPQAGLELGQHLRRGPEGGVGVGRGACPRDIGRFWPGPPVPLSPIRVSTCSCKRTRLGRGTACSSRPLLPPARELERSRRPPGALLDSFCLPVTDSLAFFHAHKRTETLALTTTAPSEREWRRTYPNHEQSKHGRAGAHAERAGVRGGEVRCHTPAQPAHQVGEPHPEPALLLLHCRAAPARRTGRCKRVGWERVGGISSCWASLPATKPNKPQAQKVCGGAAAAAGCCAADRPFRPRPPPHRCGQR